ncbi:hypothetical protein SAMN02745215_00566 [Desulfitobacterium chlororespirans DSM 11544]|uniref:Uncharacterized protein n=1 Tax=Desulfitobacterium chlororespirans DSM 11544 TaxID=1121395 RepID=A0A1M7S5E9_9FIRM|nr:hypothetical protein SAMN02745215_00566 [Desulfitobacterium chlororespirans DSM 11544]
MGGYGYRDVYIGIRDHEAYHWVPGIVFLLLLRFINGFRLGCFQYSQ